MSEFEQAHFQFGLGNIRTENCKEVFQSNKMLFPKICSEHKIPCSLTLPSHTFSFTDYVCPLLPLIQVDISSEI